MQVTSLLKKATSNTLELMLAKIQFTKDISADFDIVIESDESHEQLNCLKPS